MSNRLVHLLHPAANNMIKEAEDNKHSIIYVDSRCNRASFENPAYMRYWYNEYPKLFVVLIDIEDVNIKLLNICEVMDE